MANTENFKFAQSSSVFNKRSTEDILRDAETIDASKVGEEVIRWACANVENFIDNQTKFFKIDLVLDSSEGMTETKKLQDLYRAIPDDEGNEKDLEYSQKCRRILDEITLRAYNKILESNILLKELFNRMIFYYEKIIPNPENRKKANEIDADLKSLIFHKERAIKEEDKKKIQEEIIAKLKEGESLVKFEQFEGTASITKFEYDAFNVGVQLSEPQKSGSDNQEKKVMKQYDLIEGFTVWIEISYKHKQRPTNMF